MNDPKQRDEPKQEALVDILFKIRKLTRIKLLWFTRLNLTWSLNVSECIYISMIFGTKITLRKALLYINGFLNPCRLHSLEGGGEIEGGNSGVCQGLYLI